MSSHLNTFVKYTEDRRVAGTTVDYRFSSARTVWHPFPSKVHAVAEFIKMDPVIPTTIIHVYIGSFSNDTMFGIRSICNYKL